MKITEFSWKRVFKILRRSNVSEKTYQKYVNKSSYYPQCATGELREHLEAQGYLFNNKAQPQDQAIRMLSNEFHNALVLNQVDKAEEIYDVLKILANI